MAAGGVSVDETVECGGIGSGEATDRLLALAQNDYRAVKVASNRVEFARTYRPTWAIVVGIALLPVLVGVGVSNAAQAAEAVGVADGVVQGASVVRRLMEQGPDAVGEYVAEVRAAIDAVGHPARG